MTTYSETFRSASFTTFAWIAAIGFAVGALALVVAIPFDSAPISNHLGPAILFAITALAFRRVTRMRVDMDDRGLTIVRLIGVRRIAWDDIADVNADYGGLHVALKDGSEVVSTALGKTNMSTWLNKRTDVDHAVSRIRNELAAQRS